MKRFLIGMLIGWITVPILSAGYSVINSDHSITNPTDNDDLRDSHAYKWYLTEILVYMRSMDVTLKSLDTNIKAVKDKLKV